GGTIPVPCPPPWLGRPLSRRGRRDDSGPHSSHRQSGAGSRPGARTNWPDAYCRHPARRLPVPCCVRLASCLSLLLRSRGDDFSLESIGHGLDDAYVHHLSDKTRLPDEIDDAVVFGAPGQFIGIAFGWLLD